ncbi:hypothetical protein RJT34_01469 [Clitoria ternatea]|uniref:Uncharacterized protein n=1 Tax=Clitoria ternatea TaxID=43366 RepID=A0AAN9KKC0_CLITE
MASSPRTVEEIFKDFSARRTAVVRALTQDVDEFYGLYDPGKGGLFVVFFHLKNYGAFLEKDGAGIRGTIKLTRFEKGDIDLSKSLWTHQDYQAMVAQLEHQFRLGQGLWFYCQPMTRSMQALSTVIQKASINNFSGSAILNLLQSQVLKFQLLTLLYMLMKFSLGS